VACSIPDDSRFQQWTAADARRAGTRRGSFSCNCAQNVRTAVVARVFLWFDRLPPMSKRARNETLGSDSFWPWSLLIGLGPFLIGAAIHYWLVALLAVLVYLFAIVVIFFFATRISLLSVKPRPVSIAPPD